MNKLANKINSSIYYYTHTVHSGRLTNKEQKRIIQHCVIKYICSAWTERTNSNECIFLLASEFSEGVREVISECLVALSKYLCIPVLVGDESVFTPEIQAGVVESLKDRTISSKGWKSFLKKNGLIQLEKSLTTDEFFRRCALNT